MFEKGQAVKCIDAKMGRTGPCLTEGRIYHIEEFISPEECSRRWPDNHYHWEKEGGRVELKEEHPPANHFFGRRFQAI